MTDDELDLLLENWGRWCRFAKSIGMCESIERAWRTPQCWEEEDPYATAPVGEGGRVQALRVNRAWLSMPDLYKRVLRDWYAFRRNPRVTCRLLAIPFRAHGEYLAKARVMCRNLLLCAV